MEGISSSVYVRIPFEVANPESDRGPDAAAEGR